MRNDVTSHSSLAGHMHKMILVLVNSLRLSDTYLCIGKLTIIGSDNGLLPGQHQAII